MHTLKSFSAALAVGAALALSSGTGMALADTVSTMKPASETGSFTVHKFVVPNSFTPGSYNKGGAPLGTEPDGATPVEGVEYTIQPLAGSADKIRTTEGMKELTAIATSLKDDPSTVGSIALDGSPITQTTDASGQAVFSNLPQGAYLVKETSVANAKSDEALVPGAPFVVFVPTTTADGSAFNYDVHAYPKNTTLGVTKKFTNLDTIPQSGQTLSYQISAGIPKVGPSGTITKYVIQDDIPNQVEFKAVAKVTAGGEALTEGTDYEVTHNDAHMEITFKEGGLTKLAAHQADADKVVVDLDTTVKTALVDGVTQNTAVVVFNNGSGNGDTTTNGDTPPGPSYAKLKIKKISSVDDSDVLAGATFELHWCDADGQVSKDLPNPVESLVTGEGADATLSSQVTTKKDGTATFEGLQKLKDDNNHKYCLVELKAPEGFVKRNDPFVVKNFSEASNGSFTEGVYAADVTNVPNPDADLPGTGGSGKGLLGFGLVAALAAGGGLVYSRRQSAQK